MSYYSFEVLSPCPLAIVDPLVVLDRGRNVFSAEVSDIVAFRQTLLDEGCKIVHENQLSCTRGEWDEITTQLPLGGVRFGHGTESAATGTRLLEDGHSSQDEAEDPEG